jgi:hypothetical protein
MVALVTVAYPQRVFGFGAAQLLSAQELICQSGFAEVEKQLDALALTN